jgi:hypothetical protein
MLDRSAELFASSGSERRGLYPEQGHVNTGPPTQFGGASAEVMEIATADASLW